MSGEIGYRAQDPAVQESKLRTELVCKLVTLTLNFMHPARADRYHPLFLANFPHRSGSCVGTSVQYMSCCIQVRIICIILYYHKHNWILYIS